MRNSFSTINKLLAPIFFWALAHYHAALAHQASGRVGAAVRHFRAALALQAYFPAALCSLARAQSSICDWSSREATLVSVRASLVRQLDEGACPALQPFDAFAVPLELPLVLRLAQAHAAAAEAGSAMGLLLGAVAAGAPTAARALRRRLFALHDRSRLEVFCYSLRQSDRSAPRAAVESAAEHFVDVSSSDSAAIAARIAADGIHVCVDLNGFTSGARTELFALRPAPLQVGMLGFPGSSGGAFLDYLATDAVASPPQLERLYSRGVCSLPSRRGSDASLPRDRHLYSEALLRLPPSYGLPPLGVVFCCFSQLYKVDPATFAAWLSILRRVPGSVLWLLRFPLEGEADLFLDTPLCNGHTTAADALWAGMIADGGIGDYVERAVRLGTRRVELLALRRKLWARRLSAPLFDTRLWTRTWEHALRAVWLRHCAGEPPASMDVRLGELEAEASHSPPDGTPPGVRPPDRVLSAGRQPSFAGRMQRTHW
ncbi:hypothetical protein EMIHUDRAFT_227396 [Emiliania huxleyi CCMP1516]|uniref:O-GlcNAc transferase C-terminal domain-containing protein n=2 Tax=Emiliania huxleyi TaxID=2903 RepID=A0A0D3KIP2_EMIH1|nr:hypothetical protein EMIHUDRAFT_227396 [Emiliania huxleyi CCMP1516]EOD35627.1 hypothetical protein EMIHUDRAFT_227396 [Emiliania huxleyi CCMP1516]|eukprot:XP_005788056.1 hypothetical protein EMIHUDRAFT_227396 [Emiliania huxleyi CCMP1516]